MTTEGTTLQERIARTWEDRGARCLGFVNRRGEVRWWSAARLFDEAGARAAWLAESGLGPGDVAILVTADPRFAAVCLVGILRLGAVPLLVAPPSIQGVNSNLGRVLRHVAGLSKARVALLPRGMEAEARALSECGVNALIGDGGRDFEGRTAALHTPRPDDIAALQLTSGTTGLPRICTWKHHQVLHAIDGMSAGMRLRPDDRFVNWTPLYHDMGLVNNALLCLVRGLELVLMDPFHFVGDPALWLRTLHQVQATQTWSPNFGYALATERIGDEELDGVRLDTMRGFWNAGEKVHHHTFVAFHQRFRGHGVRWPALKANFGCAENIGGATFTDPDGELVVERLDAAALFQEHRAVVVPDGYEGPTEVVVSTGKGHPTLKARILGEDGEVLEDGHIGRIALASPSRMVGFLGQPDETAAVMGEDHVLTGDLGYLRDGELFWVGRYREQINLAGVKHDPSDFEAALNEVEGLRKGCFAAFGVQDETLGTQRLVIVCEVRGAIDDAPAICQEIRRRIATQLGTYVSEVALTPRGQLTKTSSGKRRHLYFRDAYRNGELTLSYWRRFDAE